jgi:hypothetical protein
VKSLFGYIVFYLIVVLFFWLIDPDTGKAYALAPFIIIGIPIVGIAFYYIFEWPFEKRDELNRNEQKRKLELKPKPNFQHSATTNSLTGIELEGCLRWIAVGIVSFSVPILLIKFDLSVRLSMLMLFLMLILMWFILSFKRY